MTKKTFVVMCVFVFLLVVGSSCAEPFSFRNGIRWYASKEEVDFCLRSEPGSDNYNFDYELKDLYEVFPQEKTNPQLWVIDIDNISLGRDDESVELVLWGTKKTGLYRIYYYVKPYDSSDDSIYNRANDLIAQMSQKYGKMQIADGWKKRKSLKDREIVYGGRAALSDNTYIMVLIKKDGSSYALTVEYESAKAEEIVNAMNDGTFWVETAYGL